MHENKENKYTHALDMIKGLLRMERLNADLKCRPSVSSGRKLMKLYELLCSASTNIKRRLKTHAVTKTLQTKLNCGFMDLTVPITVSRYKITRTCEMT